VAPVGLVRSAFGWDTRLVIQLAEELEVWDFQLRWIRSGTWVHNTGQIFGKVPNTSVQFAKLLCALVDRHERTRNAESIIWTIWTEVELEGEQLVYIYGVGIDGGRYRETIPCHA
jgi:hypothetical protein